MIPALRGLGVTRDEERPREENCAGATGGSPMTSAVSVAVPIAAWPEVVYMSLIGPILLQCNGWGQGPPNEQPPMLATRVQSPRSIDPQVYKSFSTNPLPSATPWPKVIFLSPDGPVVLQCTGWGQPFSPGLSPPLLAMRMEPQPPLIPLATSQLAPTSTTGAPPLSHTSVQVSVMATPPKPTWEGKKFLVKSRFWAEGFYIYDEDGEKVYKCRRRPGSLRLYDTEDKQIAGAEWSVMRMFNQVCTMFVNGNPIGTVTKAEDSYPALSMKVNMLGYKFTGDIFHWKYELRDEMDRLILQAERQPSDVNDKYEVIIYELDHTVPGLILMCLLFHFFIQARDD